MGCFAPNPTCSRRAFLAAGGAALASLLLPRGARSRDFEPSAAARQALDESPLVYVSPLLASGAESTCHGEVWFVALDGDVLVVTAADRWKARALERGLSSARLWVGDHGVWTRSGGKFKQAPSFRAEASLVADAAMRERALLAFGAKYPGEWGKWGPRFRGGLADGSRVLIRYAPRGG